LRMHAHARARHGSALPSGLLCSSESQHSTMSADRTLSSRLSAEHAKRHG
jgi:hypothetical protein